MCLVAGMQIAVITGATSNPLLREAMLSVDAQVTRHHLQHWIVVDGQEHDARVRRLVGKLPVSHSVDRHVLTLPHNTGGSGYVCHRINGAIPWLVNADYVCFLDQDNAYAPNHIQALADVIGDAHWAFSLRAIVNEEGAVVCTDMCESLGSLCHTVLHPLDRLVDTNCYMLRRDTALKVCPAWNVKARQPGEMEADRRVCAALLNEPHAVSRVASVLYRAGGRHDSVSPAFFATGNAVLGRGVGGYDFVGKRDVYLFHFNPLATADYIASSRVKSPLEEWCMTMWDDVARDYNILDGFANIQHIPDGATCLVAMCNPNTLPMDVFKRRRHRVVLYCAEGPNYRHRAQWDTAFLNAHFDVVLTYWQPLLDAPEVPGTMFCPHNSRFMQFPRDLGIFRENTGAGASVCMVLERRPTNAQYTINGVKLRALDFMREVYVKGMRDVTVYGNGWAEFCAANPRVTMGRAAAREDTPSVDILCKYTFALVIENCDAEGYVSEKVGDAFIAGAIPLYLGNASALVEIPAGAYIDISGFKDGGELQGYLDSLGPEDIAGYRAAIARERVAYLERRGSRAVAACVRLIAPLQPPTPACGPTRADG